MEIKTIIFDYGSVVFEPSAGRQIRKIVKKHNVSEKMAFELFATSPRKEGYKLRTGKITSREYWKIVKNKTGMTIKETMDLRKKSLEIYKPKPGMIDLLKRLNKNYRLVVFSGNIRERVMHVNRKYKVNRFFSEFIFSFTHGYNKNDSRFYKIVQKRIKHPEQTIMIDDKQRVLTQMNNHGFNNTILYKNTAQLKRELKKYNINF